MGVIVDLGNRSDMGMDVTTLYKIVLNIQEFMDTVAIFSL
jgi:hypothetical protein